MAKQKLFRYATVGTYPNVVELDPQYRGRWASGFFGNSNPIVLELACGKGHYTLELAKQNPDKNFVGVDIKGERIFVGAQTALEEEIPNAGFLRTQIEFLERFFAPGEVSEIWITFPDPYLRKPKKRLTSPRFLEIYRNVVAPDSRIHLKTDDPVLHESTLKILAEEGIPVDAHIPDVYASPDNEAELYIQTFYEKQHLANGRTIRYVRFLMGPNPNMHTSDEAHMSLTNDPAEMRQEYTLDGLMETDVAANPIVQFRDWFDQAVTAGITEPNAMTLATCGTDLQPSARTVLLKGFDEHGFTFFTNYESQKADDLSENPKAALLFFWEPMQRQVRIEGEVIRVTRDASRTYFDSRPVTSRIGAWSSAQSRVIADRDALDHRFLEFEARFQNGEIPLPEFWGGYCVIPHTIEFWQGRASRLHDRIRYRKVDDQWVMERLMP